MTKNLTVSGSSATVPLQTASQLARWVTVGAASGNTDSIYVGGPTTASGVGQETIPGAAQFFPVKASGGYDLNQIFAYITTGDSAQVTYEEL